MPDSFIPSKDANALLWFQNFATILSNNQGIYSVNNADCLTISNAVNAFAAAMTVASQPSTRTPSAISLKNQTRNSAEQVCRQYAIGIKISAGISDQAKIDAGVRPPNNQRESIECPQTSPIVSPIAATMGSQTIRYSDSMTPDSAAKPFGASDLILFCAVTENNVADPALAKFVGKFTKNPISVQFSAAENGKQATYFARWSSRKGEMGPWSVPVSLAIAA